MASGEREKVSWPSPLDTNLRHGSLTSGYFSFAFQRSSLALVEQDRSWLCSRSAGRVLASDTPQSDDLVNAEDLAAEHCRPRVPSAAAIGFRAPALRIE